MESRNYTYAETYYNGPEFHVIDRDGKTIAVCDRESYAELIVAALNGIAP